MLHNYVITEDSVTSDEIFEEDECPIVRQLNPPLDRFNYLPTVETFDPPSGSSSVRDIIVRHTTSHAKVQPARNIARNLGREEEELEDINLM